MRSDLISMSSDNTVDLGATGAGRLKDVYISGAIKEGAWNGTDIGVGYIDGTSGTNTQVLTTDGTNASWQDPVSSGGDVTAAAVLGDNLLIRGDGAVKGVQNSGITIDDNDVITGIGRYIEMTYQNDTANVAPFIKMQSARAGGADLQDNDYLGDIRFYGMSNGGYQQGATIGVSTDGTPGGATDMPSDIFFATSADGSATPTTRLTIGSDGVATFTETISGSITGNAGTVTGFTPASGSLTLSGADAVTITTTASTNVTLPTSGTLITASSTDSLTNKTFDANGTGNSLSNVDVADLSDGTDGELITWAADGTADTVAVGTDGQVLTSNGAGAAPTFQDASGGGATSSISISSNFEGLNRTSEAQGGTGSSVVGNFGVLIATGGTGSSYSRLDFPLSADLGMDLYNGSPTLSLVLTMSGLNATAGEIYVGLAPIAVSGSGHTFTNDHIGFKLVESGGTISVFATQADDTTENTSAALTTVASGDSIELFLKVNGSSSVDYYWQKSGTGWSSATNLTSNLPTITQNGRSLQFSTTNATDADEFSFYVNSFKYSR
jgi:hypothetical protein